MSDHANTKSAAELEREVDIQRNKLESRIDEIQARLSPGQLVDELLSYTKGGGTEFLGNFQKTVTANPLPATLLGVSLAWLIAKPASTTASEMDSRRSGDREWDKSINERRGYEVDGGSENGGYPVATITGRSLRRTRHTSEDGGNFISEFADEAGKTYRAASDKVGNRAGHFIDETGARFRGFTDSAGGMISSFEDEAGNLIDDAAGWASHSWRKAHEKLHDAQDALRSGRNALGDRASHMQGQLHDQAQHLNQTIANSFREQPLVAGALAFAIGAALASTLPHTAQEDELLGEQADKVKAKLGAEASKAYDKGKDQIAEIYDKATETTDALYNQAKVGVAEALSEPQPLPR